MSKRKNQQQPWSCPPSWISSFMAEEDKMSLNPNVIIWCSCLRKNKTKIRWSTGLKHFLADLQKAIVVENRLNHGSGTGRMPQACEGDYYNRSSSCLWQEKLFRTLLFLQFWDAAAAYIGTGNTPVTSPSVSKRVPGKMWRWQAEQRRPRGVGRDAASTITRGFSPLFPEWLRWSQDSLLLLHDLLEHLPLAVPFGELFGDEDEH